MAIWKGELRKMKMEKGCIKAVELESWDIRSIKVSSMQRLIYLADKLAMC